ncbi:TonB family protein [Caldithrix abyssi]
MKRTPFNKRFNQIAALVLLTAWGVCAQTTVIRQASISGEARWSGVVLVQGDVTIERGARLIIEPGTIIKFATSDAHRSGADRTRCELIVKGALIARGEIDRKIIFTSAAEHPKMHDWSGIRIINMKQPAQFEYVIVEYAYNGFDIKKSDPLIRNSQIRYNYNAGLRIAVRSEAKLIGNIIQDNGYAGVICETGARPVLTDNMITKNQIGVIIFGTAKPNLGDLSKKDGQQGRNGLFENYEYDVYNHGSNDILAEGNSWGTEDKQTILERIFDGQDSPQYGIVDFNPIVGNIDLDRKILIAQQPENYLALQPPAQDSMAEAPASAEATTPLPQIPLEQDTIPMARPVELAVAESVAQTPPETIATAEQTESSAEEPAETQHQIDFDQIFLDVFLDKKLTMKKKVAPVVDNPERGMNDHGNVIIRVIVGKDGRVEQAEVLRSLNYYYDGLALKAARQFVFEPGTVKGVKVRFSTTLVFKF